MKYIKLLNLLTLVIILQGCTGFLTSNENDNPSGAADIFGEDTYFERVNIFQLLDPSENTVNENGVGKENDEEVYYYLEYSLSKFYERISALTPEQQKIERNRTQFRIISASNQRCGDFKNSLHKYQGDVNFALGSLTTVLAGAGAVLSHEQTAKEFAALAGVTSGVRAEFNSSYFKNITIDVVGKGIDSARSQILGDIKKKTNFSFIDYTVEEAISDAIKYHSACNVISGLQEASKALTKQELDQGVASLVGTYATIRQVNSPILDDLEQLFKRSQDVNPVEYSLKAELNLAQLKEKKNTVSALNPDADSNEEAEKASILSELASIISKLESGYLSTSEKKKTLEIKNGWPEIIAKINISQEEGQKEALVSQLQAEVSAAEKRQVDLGQLILSMQKLSSRSDELIESLKS